MPAAKGNSYSANRKINPMYSDDEIAVIIDDLLEWAYSDNGIYISTYVYEKYKRAKSWLYQLSDHHPELKDALDTTRELIAGKIGNHCFIGDRNSAFGEKILPIYCKIYKEETVRKAQLAKQSQSDMQATADQFVQAIKANKLLDLLKQDDKDA